MTAISVTLVIVSTLILIGAGIGFIVRRSGEAIANKIDEAAGEVRKLVEDITVEVVENEEPINALGDLLEETKRLHGRRNGASRLRDGTDDV